MIWVHRILLLGIFLPLIACGGGGAGGGGAGACATPSTEVSEIKAFPPDVVLLPNGSAQLAGRAYNACGYQISKVDFQWTSENPSVVSVDNAGRVIGKVVGSSARITLTQKGAGGEGALSGSVMVSVVEPPTTTPAVSSIQIFPPDPVVTVQTRMQFAAVAYDSNGKLIPGVDFRWRSDNPAVAVVDGGGTSGVVQGVVQGATIITVDMAERTSLGFSKTTLIVLQQDGAPMPPPTVTVSPGTLLMAVGDTHQAEAQVTDTLTGKVVSTPVTWQVTPTGVVDIVPISADGRVVNVTGLSVGAAVMEARVVVGGVTVLSPPVDVSVLEASARVDGTWSAVGQLPPSKGVHGHGMTAAQGHLVVTGGIIGEFYQGGPSEQVFRARIRDDGSLERADATPGWDRSPRSSSADPAVAVFESCTGDPACMNIFREAQLDVTGAEVTPPRWVRYQVFGHGQVATENGVYVVGGIDAQVDLGIEGPQSLGGVGPQVTRYSDRVLIGTVGVDGSITEWRETTRLPTFPLGGLIDVPGRFRPAVVQYGSWLYVMGGWSWVLQNGEYVGRNRDEVFRASIFGDGSLGSWSAFPISYLPERLNKHAARVMGDWLIVAGGAAGVDAASPELVSREVWIAPLDPFDGSIGNWRLGPDLPSSLQNLQLVGLPGDPYVVALGGDDGIAANPLVFVSQLDPLFGTMNDWFLLPDLPVPQGLTSSAAAAVRTPSDPSGWRIYVSGGGYPKGYDVTDLTRSSAVYMLEVSLP